MQTLRMHCNEGEDNVSETVAIHAIIHGRVQGVGYRAWTSRHAQKRGLRGWVRNRTDGTVEAVFVGDEAVVETMLDDCASGPLAAKVLKIDRTLWEGDRPESFTQRPTA